MNAYILCGGKSRRMGRTKATIPFQKKPMAVHIALQAHAAGFKPFFVVKPSQQFDFSFPILFDQTEKTHPLSGILLAMKHCSEEVFLVLPCDTPFLTPDSLSQFLDIQSPAIAYDGRRHPLIGLYTTKDQARAEMALQENYSMKTFSRDFPTVFFPSEELHNCNHPEDL